LFVDFAEQPRSDALSEGQRRWTLTVVPGSCRIAVGQPAGGNRTQGADYDAAKKIRASARDRSDFASS